MGSCTYKTDKKFQLSDSTYPRKHSFNFKPSKASTWIVICILVMVGATHSHSCERNFFSNKNYIAYSHYKVLKPFYLNNQISRNKIYINTRMLTFLLTLEVVVYSYLYFSSVTSSLKAGITIKDWILLL